MHDTMDFDPDASFPAEDIRLLQQAIMTLTEVIDRNKKLADSTEQLLTTEIRLLRGNMDSSAQYLKDMIYDRDEQWQIKVKDLQNQILDLKGVAAQKAMMIPPIEQISKIKIQLMDNRKPSPNWNQKTPSGKANFKLKFYIWACPIAEVSRFLEGNCGSLYMNLYSPSDRNISRRHGAHLDYLQADDAQMIGALFSADGKQRLWDQAGILMQDHHLFLQVRDRRLDFGCGFAGSPDWKAGAHVRRWFWPDTGNDG